MHLNIQLKDKSTTEYAGRFDYTRMFERDPVNANALRVVFIFMLIQWLV